ncbi:CPBP family glutamic-type intramembrane protease [soil metagenome]
MARSRSTASISSVPLRHAAPADDYWTLSTRPLHSLVILMPLIAIYELGAVLFLTDVRTGMQSDISARRAILEFFNLFGVFGLLLPGLAMVSVLLVWHLVSRDSWRVRGWVLLGMVLEAAMWALPLIVFAALVQRAAAMNAAAAVEFLPLVGRAGDANALVPTMPAPARFTIAVGAGLYEELLFRLVAIAGLHFLVKDVLQSKEAVAATVAIAGSALAFALYHPLYTPGDPARIFQWTRLIFFMGAGAYFACLYLFRGFAIVVYAHAIYDIIVLVIKPTIH